MKQRVRVTGEGRVQVPGYGIADAEDRIEKDVRALFPTGLFRILQTRRTDPEPKIVETFEVEYRVVVAVEVDPDETEKMRRKAFGMVRDTVLGSRIQQIQWLKAEVEK